MEKGSLRVYRASAGSGKTFRLTVEYIKLLMENRMAFMNTLAVTFTNKATEEMKTRILGALYGISRGGEKRVVNVLVKETGLDETTIREKCGQALSDLVRQYGYFHVETIDSFFQSVLRNLARELGLTPNLKVDLRDKEIESEAVDLMIERLKADDEVLAWITDFIGENIKDNKGWNVIKSIKNFSENLFKEEYSNRKEKFEAIVKNAEFFDEFKKRLYGIRKCAREELQDIVKGFDALREKYGIGKSDLSHPLSYFNKIEKGEYLRSKIIGKNIQKALDAVTRDDIISAWLTKDNRKEHPEYEDIIVEVLNPYLIASEKKRVRAAHDFYSANVTLKHINQLRLLHRIEQVVREENNAHNRFLLSETQPLLNKMIGDNDAPFIYEKIGTRIDNIMIDEFQDTSVLQWQNFRVLLDECMARMMPGHLGNMIVGDVKQSIYRWRSGDWRLLNNLLTEIPGAVLATPPLDTNRRSAENIVKFNNIFFTEAIKHETTKLAGEYAEEIDAYVRAYSDCIQNVNPRQIGSNEGYVEVDVVGKDEIYEKTFEIIHDLLSQGVKPNDIVVLARGKKELQRIARYCLENDPDLVLISDDSFRLDASDAVNVIVGAMALVGGVDDNLSTANLVATYLRIKGIKENCIQADTDYTSLLPQEFIDSRAKLAEMPIHDMAEEIVRIFELDKKENENAYICAFFDYLDRFTTDHSVSAADLVEYWNDFMSEKTIRNDNANGIQLMTIHKSKGLERENVIVTFNDWPLERSNTVLWLTTDEEPYNQLPVIPVGFNKSLVESAYSKSYHNEHLMNMVDNMNMLYVAFTRTRSNLFAIMNQGTDSYRSGTIDAVLSKLSNDTPEDWAEANPIFEIEKKKLKRFQLGKIRIKTDNSSADKDKKDDNIFTRDSIPVYTNINVYHKKGSFLQSSKSDEYISSGEDLAKGSYIDDGILLHDIFSHIKTGDDIERVISEMVFEGRLDNDKARRFEKLIRNRVTQGDASVWFDGSWDLYNECNIISSPSSGKSKTRRPERVMIRGNEAVVVDFKFASGNKEASYKKQVREYMTFLREMGYKQVSGYIWYVYRNAIIEVKTEE